MHTVPVPTVTISPPGPIQKAVLDNPVVINCTVTTVSGVESSSVMISWTGPGETLVTDDSRVIIGPITSTGNTYTRSLQFTHLVEGDEGTYTCNVMILKTNMSQSVELQPLTSKLSLTCCTIITCVLKAFKHIYDIIYSRYLSIVSQSIELQCVVISHTLSTSGTVRSRL